MSCALDSDPEFPEDLQYVLDRRTDDALRTRDALLEPYAGWSKDRTLGPPFDLGFQDRPDGLDPLVERAARAGLATRYIEGVKDALADFDQLVLNYRDGLLSQVAVKTWRGDVERLYKALATAIDGAHAWRRTEGGGATRAKAEPDLSLLEHKELLSTEDLARVLGVGPEQARRRRRRGEFGEIVLKQGRRKYVRSDAVREAIGGAGLDAS